jgi:hypothetical protein
MDIAFWQGKKKAADAAFFSEWLAYAAKFFATKSQFTKFQNAAT